VPQKITQFREAFRKSTKGDAWELAVQVTPKASQTKIGEVTLGSDGQPYLKVYVTAVPEDNKANKALIALLAKTFKIPKSSLQIISGKTDRRKVVRIEGNFAP
jgi:hypothetical protein